ncbi:MAG: exodeoxyribonuclease VII large subunit [Thermoanaerobaculia bacterium]
MTDFEPTYSVSALGRGIKELLGEAFASVWVAGEIQRYKASPAGHHYFDLVEKGDGDKIVGVLSAVVWKGEFLRLRAALDRAGARLADGQKVRCRVGVDFYPPGGRLQVQVREIDPNFTLGELARRREETIEALSAAGLLERNKALPLAEIPLRLALVTSAGSAAYHDFLATLAESGYGFRVLFVHSAVQGPEAEASLPSAIALAAGSGCDLVVLIRGGGSKSDLAVFDSRAVAQAVAMASAPVWTGLGHEIDEAVADLAAHRSWKTPTKVAEELVLRVGAAELAAARLGERLVREVRRSLAEATARLARAERRALAGRERLRRASTRLAALAEGLKRAAQFRLRSATLRLDGWARLAAGLEPRRVLARGYSLTRDSRGALLRDADTVRSGDRITTELATGSLISEVKEVG